MSDKIRILCVGAGNMGSSHARAYHKLDAFEIAGIVTRSPESRGELNRELGGGYPEFGDYLEALAETKPEAVSISTYPDTHAPYAEAAFEAGAHVFIEKPLAETVAQAEAIVAKGPRHQSQAGDRLHPATPPQLDQIHRARADPRQAPRDAHEPEPAVVRDGLGNPPEPDLLHFPDRRLRGALRGRDVPDDAVQAGAGIRVWVPAFPTRSRWTRSTTGTCR